MGKLYGNLIWSIFFSFKAPVQNSDHSWPCKRILRFLVSWRKAECVLLLSSWFQLEGSFPYLQLTSWTGNRMCSAQDNRPSYETSRSKQSTRKIAFGGITFTCRYSNIQRGRRNRFQLNSCSSGNQFLDNWSYLDTFFQVHRSKDYLGRLVAPGL